MKGEFETIIRNKNRGIKTKFIVVRGHIDNLPLIGRDTLIEQSMMILELGTLKKQTSGINEPKSTKEVTGGYDDVFPRNGKY